MEWHIDSDTFCEPISFFPLKKLSKYWESTEQYLIYLISAFLPLDWRTEFMPQRFLHTF